MRFSRSAVVVAASFGTSCALIIGADFSDKTVREAADGSLDGSPGDGAFGEGNGGVDSSNPGRVTSGAMECDLDAGQVCCLGTTEGGRACTDGNCSGPIMRCDETEDCPSKMVCCASFFFNGVGTDCWSFCPGLGSNPPTARACRRNEECDGATCASFPCQGVPISTCGGDGRMLPQCK